MSKELERAGLPTSHVCSIVPISRTVGANRIVPSVAIPHPLGDPDKTPEEEPAVAVVLNNMGVLCNKMGQLRRAQESHERALDIRVRLRGLHLDTAESVYNLASVYAHSGDKKSARLLFLRAGELLATRQALEGMGAVYPEVEEEEDSQNDSMREMEDKSSPPAGSEPKQGKRVSKLLRMSSIITKSDLPAVDGGAGAGVGANGLPPPSPPPKPAGGGAQPQQPDVTA